MYSYIKSAVLDLLRVPQEPPDAPSGSEAATDVFRASKRFLQYRLFTGLILPLVFVFMSLTASVVSFIVLLDGGTPVYFLLSVPAVLITVCLTIVSYFLVRVEYDLRYYIVTDRSIRIREGVWTVHESTFTFANVQNLSVKQGPIDSLLGISHLIVHTAGGGGGNQSQEQYQSAGMQRNMLRGIDNARAVRDRIQNLVKQYRDAGLGDERSASDEQPAGAASKRRISPSGRNTLEEIRDEVIGIRRAFARMNRGSDGKAKENDSENEA